MENDSIRPSGSSTLVDIWIDGKVRAICVSRAAIEAHLRLPPDEAAAMTENDRCEFVRTHLPAVIAAAKARLSDMAPGADSILIDGGQLGGGGKERRSGTDRRKSGERRGRKRLGPDRRKADRRSPPKSRDPS
jgi:hypothetical protein